MDKNVKKFTPCERYSRVHVLRCLLLLLALLPAVARGDCGQLLFGNETSVRVTTDDAIVAQGWTNAVRAFS